MGFLKKCDICGKAYEPYNVAKRSAGPNGIAFANIPNCTKDPFHGTFPREIFDCCPEDMKKISDFLDSLRKGYPTETPPIEEGESDDAIGTA